jgi:uncharacterized RDD family membrane protein YckC
VLIYYLRRLGAAFYDGLLLLAFWLLTTFVLVILSGHTLVSAHAGTLSKLPYWGALLCVAWGFFTWFWSHGGQTLGMRAWKLQVRNDPPKIVEESHPSPTQLRWTDASRRFFVALVVWVFVGAVVIPTAWYMTKHIPFSARVMLLLGAWVLVSLAVSILPYSHGRSIVDRYSRTRIVLMK